MELELLGECLKRFVTPNCFKLKGKTKKGKAKRKKFSIQAQRRASADDTSSLLFTLIFLFDKIIMYSESKKMKFTQRNGKEKKNYKII